MRIATIIIILFFLGDIHAQNLISVSKDTLLMGSAFRLTAIHTTEKEAQNCIDEALTTIGNIENKISSWKTSTQTSLINANAGIKPIKVDAELFDLIARAKKISTLSNGYFDLSFASIDKVWKFDSSYITLPDRELIKQSVSKINYNNIALDTSNQTVFLKEKGMKIGFGAIGKGYAADRAKQVMMASGAKSGVVNAGGDLLAWGNKPDGKPWSIGIADPNNKTNILSWLNISDMAVATSGNYEKYINIKGKRYCHIINPKTGWPVSGVKSVSIVCKSAELADGLATTVFVLGVYDGIKMIDRLEGVECLIIDDENKMHYSKNIQLNIIANDK